MLTLFFSTLHVVGFISSIHAIMGTRTAQGTIAWALFTESAANRRGAGVLGVGPQSLRTDSIAGLWWCRTGRPSSIVQLSESQDP